MKAKFCWLWALFACVLVAIVWPSSAHAQDYTDPDGLKTYMFVARVSPGLEAKIVAQGGKDGGNEEYNFLANLTRFCQEGGGGPVPGYGVALFSPKYEEARCQLMNVVTAHTVNSIQDAYKNDVLDGINHMPQQLKDELRKVAEPEIESEVQTQVLSQLNSAKPSGRDFSWLIVLIAAAVGAVVGAGTATAVALLRK